MQEIFPEGFVFTWALYGLSSVQVAAQLGGDDPRRTALLREARRAGEQVDSDLGRAPFDDDLDPPYGAFQNAWSLYVRAELARATGAALEPAFRARFTRDCVAFAAALERSPSPFLPSYARSAWPADTAVAIAALGIHDQLFPPRFGRAIASWSGAVRPRLDPELGALAHAAEVGSGAPRMGVRGSSLALVSRVLVDADPELARAHYEILRQHFVDFTWGVPGIREYPHGVRGPGDVDSGPILLGFSGPAVVVGAAAARAHGDIALADTLMAAVEVGGLPVELGGARRYAGGLVPVGDAFIAWARSTPVERRARQALTPKTWEPLVPRRWALPAHLVSALAIGLLLVPPVRWLREWSRAER